MAVTVRDGQRVAATCPECGCRLKKFETTYSHFLGVGERDARGCLCPSLYIVWLREEASNTTVRLDAKSFRL